MKPVTRHESFQNKSVMNDFWEVTENNFSNIRTNPVIQMGFWDDHVKSRILDLITNAEETIFLATFLLSDDEVVDALEKASSSNNIRVYILTSNNALLDREQHSDLDEFSQQVVDHHKSILKKLSQTCLVRGSPHLHAKFILTDPRTNPKGMVLTSNVTREALLRNPELAVILQKPEIEELFKAFRYAFWTEANQELTDRKWREIDLKSFKMEPSRDIITTISGQNTLESSLIEIIKKSSDTLYVGTYKMTDNTRFFEELVKYAENHKVVVFTRLHPTNQIVYDILSKMDNVNLIASKYFHAKFVISSKQGIITTANFNPISFDDGFEVGVSINTSKDVLKLLTTWSTNLEYHNIQSKEISAISSDSVMSLNPKSGKFDSITLQESDDHKESIDTKSIEEYLSWKDKDVPEPDFDKKKTIRKTISVTLTINPPTIPNKAKKVTNRNDIKNTKLLDGLDDLFDKKDKPRYDLYLGKKSLYLEIGSEKEYHKIKSKIPSQVKLAVKQ